MVKLKKYIKNKYVIASLIFLIYSLFLDDIDLFTIIEQNGNAVNISETVETKMVELRPQLFQVTWKEENGKTITQVQDYENEIVYSNVTLPNGQFVNLKGTIKQADE